MSDRQTYKNVYPLMQLLPEMDVTEEIWSQQKLHSISPTFSHVKGHQDDKKDFAELPLLAQLNVGADELAEMAYDYAPKSDKIATVLPRSPAVLIIGGVSITSRYDKRLKLASCKPQYMQYLQEKFGWTNETTNKVDWQALKLGLKRVLRTCLTVKICNDLLPTATVLKKWGYQDSDACPLCGASETIEHMCRCCHPSRIKWRGSTISELRARMRRFGTKLQLQDTFCSVMTEWLDNGSVEIEKYPKHHRIALKSQESIGWRRMLTGHISSEWGLIHPINEHPIDRNTLDSCNGRSFVIADAEIMGSKK